MRGVRGRKPRRRVKEDAMHGLPGGEGVFQADPPDPADGLPWVAEDPYDPDPYA